MEMIQRFHEGGIFMYVILIFEALTLALIIERINALFFKIKTPPPDFRQQILNLITQGDLKNAENYARTLGASTSLGKIAALGCHIRANGGGEEELQARMDEKLAAEISAIDRRTGFMAMFGNVATLLGLLGTITGMIHSFSAVAQSSPMDRATLLSKGISEAMNCTAFGLIVAIPALVAYAIFQNKTDQLVSQLTEATTEIYHDLLFLVEAARPLQPRQQQGLTVSNGSNGAGITSSAPTLSV